MDLRSGESISSCKASSVAKALAPALWPLSPTPWLGFLDFGQDALSSESLLERDSHWAALWNFALLREDAVGAKWRGRRETPRLPPHLSQRMRAPSVARVCFINSKIGNVYELDKGLIEDGEEVPLTAGLLPLKSRRREQGGDKEETLITSGMVRLPEVMGEVWGGHCIGGLFRALSKCANTKTLHSEGRCNVRCSPDTKEGEIDTKEGSIYVFK